MNISLEKIHENDKIILSNLFQLYLHDITRFLNFEINQHGLFNYKHIDNYWNENRYLPYFIKVEQKLAGFVLINNDFMCLDDVDTNYNMAEFFVLNWYRKKGIGRKAATIIFEKLKGNWEVKPIPKSSEAKLFWETIIKEYTNGNYIINYPEINREAITFSNK